MLNVQSILKSFILRASIGDIRFDPPDTETLQLAVARELCSLQIDTTSTRRWIEWACQLIEGLYPSHPPDLKVLLSICSIVIFHVDDVLSKKPEVLHSFQLNLLLGKPQTDPILECLTKVLIPQMWDYFDPVAANAIALGFYDFIDGTTTEIIAENMAYHPSAPKFPDYVRLKSGAPAQYAHWLFYRSEHSDITSYIQAIPDLLAFINRVNDILSFYKEELAGEEDNYVHMRAKISHKSVESTLKLICNETIQLIDNISDTLAVDPKNVVAFQTFVARYIRFHTSTTRYRLDELLKA